MGSAFTCIRYLGILIDSHLNWKHHVDCIVKKIRSTGILSKLRYYVGLDILLSLYYALIYPFLTYGIIIWGNTYKTTHTDTKISRMIYNCGS